MDRKSLVKRILANVVDFDMHNLFPPYNYTENLEDADSGSYTIQPKLFLRERPYTNQPLVVVPKYEGDFLEKLRKQPLEGKPVMEEAIDLYASNSDSLWDFSNPEEWLKHQERPFPRNLVDEYYEMNKPGEEVGVEVLDEYYDRSWDPGEAPEISEDRLIRYGPLPGRALKVPFHTASKRVVASFLLKFLNRKCSRGPDIGVIISSYLFNNFPVQLTLDLDNIKKAVLLDELKESKIDSRTKGIHSPDVGGVTIRIFRSEPRSGRWIFRTKSGKRPPAAYQWPYTTTFQFIPRGNEKNVNKLDVRVSCTCPSWLFWGAQYNATMKDYRYGPIRPKFAPPVIRDPNGRFLACKHILACIPWLIGTGERGKFTDEGFTLHSIDVPKEKKRVIQKAPKFEIEKRAPKEKMKIPLEYLRIGRRPEIKTMAEKWEDSLPRQRKKMIQSLDDPDEVIYFAHRFPETSTHYVAERLRQLKEVKDKNIKKKAEEGLKEIQEIEAKVEENLPEIPDKIKNFDNNQNIQELIQDLKKTPAIQQKRTLLEKQDDPDALAYMAISLYRENFLEAVNTILERLNNIIEDEKLNDSVRKKAKDWLRYIY